MNVLITGATGNVGREVIRALDSINHDINCIAGVRNLERARKSLSTYTNLEYRCFDFDDFNTFDEALTDIDIIFLLRPPHISDIEKYFVPLFNAMKNNEVNKVVFLSVQGAEKSKIIPHNKIEHLIDLYKFEFIHLRPSYFMQNLMTTLKSDILRGIIILPSKNAKFNWVDIRDIGDVAAELINRFREYQGQSIEITGLENISFPEVVSRINNNLGSSLEFKSVNPIKYYRLKKSEGYERGQIMVMMILHLLPRFQKEPLITNQVKMITGHEPITIEEFVCNNANALKTETNNK